MTDKQEPVALKPCPFCGHTDIRLMIGIGDGDRGYSYLCGGCGIRQASAGWTREQASERWNTHAKRPADDGLVARLEELAAKATPGPWEFDGNCGGYITEAGDRIARAYSQADAPLIVELVNSLPAILTALRAQSDAEVRADRGVAAGR